MNGYQTYRFTWEGIEIEARYNPLKWSVIAHLDIESIRPKRAPLPITETGYFSHHHQLGSIEEINSGDIVAFVKDWLDEAVQSKEWQDYLEAGRQLSLF